MRRIRKTLAILVAFAILMSMVLNAVGFAEADDVKLSDDASDFVLLSEAVPDAILEIRYYSTYNFVGDRIDGYEEPLALLTREAADALREVSDELVAKGYRLKIYDAYRPQMAVTNFMNWALDKDDVRMKEYFYPELEKDVLFPLGYIAEHSGHSRGSTVDLTLFDMRTEKEVDMGGTFDYFGELSHPDYTGITEEQYQNRMILREAMVAHGFRPLAEEWWHFTLENEPFPDTYFTFPINSDSVAGNNKDNTENDGTPVNSEEETAPDNSQTAAAYDLSEILAQMTTEQKLAQMTMVAFSKLDETTVSCLSEIQPGGIILFRENCPNAADTAALTLQLQKLAINAGGIPLLISTDQEGGYIIRMNESTWLPGNMAIAATGDPDNARLAASVIGEELLACGINTDFAPVVDVNSNPSNPIIGVRSFGEDPDSVAAFSREFLNGLHEAGEIAALKHFPGHGDTDTDSHTGLPCVNKTMEELLAFELVPFQTAIDAGADMVMTAHIVYPQIETETAISAADNREIYLPATLSKTILTDLLRDRMGFQGVIVTDSLIMDAIAKNFGLNEAAAMAINAGADLLLDPIRLKTKEDCETYKQLIRYLAALVEQGTIPEERLDESVMRVLELKAKYGILDQAQYDIEAFAASERANAAVGSEEHKTIEKTITEKAITLVKNEEKLIPYSAQSGEKIVVLTALDSQVSAAERGMQTAVESGAIPAGAEIRVASYDERRLADISSTMDGADLCIILTKMSGEGYLDPTSSGGISGTLVDIVIDRVHAQNGKVIVVSTQLPYDTVRYSKADAIVAAYNPIGAREIIRKDTGEKAYSYAPNIPTALRMIFDGTPMAGRLPVSVPALTEDYGFAEEILYSAGYSALSE